MFPLSVAQTGKKINNLEVKKVNGSNKATQRMRIMKHLKEGKTLTSLQAMTELGIMTLPSRISELRRRGEPIKKNMIAVQNRYGEYVRIAEYSLEKGGKTHE